MHSVEPLTRVCYNEKFQHGFLCLLLGRWMRSRTHWAIPFRTEVQRHVEVERQDDYYFLLHQIVTVVQQCLHCLTGCRHAIADRVFHFRLANHRWKKIRRSLTYWKQYEFSTDLHIVLGRSWHYVKRRRNDKMGTFSLRVFKEEIMSAYLTILWLRISYIHFKTNLNGWKFRRINSMTTSSKVKKLHTK